MATLGLKEMGKFLSGIMKSGLDAIPVFLLDDLLKKHRDSIDMVSWGLAISK